MFVEAPNASFVYRSMMRVVSLETVARVFGFVARAGSKIGRGLRLRL
jgi:hypothetical protein